MQRITISREGSIDSTASIEIGPEGVSSPTALNRELCDPDSQVSDALLTALRQLLEDVPRGERRAKLVQECGVTALADSIPGSGEEYHYATLAAQAADSQMQWFRLLEVSRQLGGTTSIGKHSSIDDILEGPIAILAAAEVVPTLAIDVREMWDLSRIQRTKLVEFFVELTAGVEIVLTNATQRVQRYLLSEFGDVLPASVTHSLESRIHGSDSVSTRTAERRQHVRDLLADRGESHDDWRRLYAVADANREQLTYDALQSHSLLQWTSREALRAWVKRMADADLVESFGSSQERTVRLLPAGYALLDEHPDYSLDTSSPLSSSGSGRTDVRNHGADTSQRSDETTVSDPPKNCDSSVYSPTAEEGEGDRPDSEAATATRGGSSSAPPATFLDGHVHDAAVSAADVGEIALCSCEVDSTGDSRGVGYSFLQERDEVVVEVEAAGYQAHTLVRLCAALLSEPAFQQVLTQDRLAGGPDRSGLDGLPVTDPYLLRDGGCIGYLRNQDADAKGLQSRLRQARDELMLMSSDVDVQEDSDDGDSDLSMLARNAHGLLGTISRIYDMLGVDITRVLKVPDWAVSDDRRRDHLARMIATQTAVSSRYGLYSAYRVLYEDRIDKRSQLLATPDVDASDPFGDTTGSWVLAGPTVDSMRDDLEDLGDYLDLQSEADGFSAFMLDLSIVDGDRREAVATALSRQLTLKSLKPTRDTVSILHALTSDIFAAARAISYLGAEADRPRNLTTSDIRYALSMLDVDELLPDVGPRTVSQVVALLLDVEEPLTTGDLADLLDVSTQTLRNNEKFFADLEAAGVIQREDLGAGRATEWRICLPFNGEEADSRAATPTPDVDITAYGPAFSDEMAVIAEVIYRIGHRDIDYGDELALAVTRTGDRLDEWLSMNPDIAPVLSLVAHLQGTTLEKLTDGAESVRYQPPKSVTLGLDPDPTTTQTSLATAD